MPSHHETSAGQPPMVSPARPLHRLRRSITEQSPPFRHSHHHHHLHRKDRDRGDRPLLPASSPMRASLDFTRSEAADSGLKPGLAGVAEIGDPTTVAASTQQHPSAREETWDQKSKAKAVVAGLRNSIDDLNAFSKSTVSRLDETYASVQEQISTLQNIIITIKELASASQQIDVNFKNESQTLAAEIESQLDPYEQSDDQKRRIRNLEARIHSGRDKVKALSNRVEVVRGRIESWERADKDWQERTRRRLRFLWIITLIIVFVVMSLAVWGQYGPSEMNINKLSELSSGNLDPRPSLLDLVSTKSKNATVMTDEVREELSRQRVQESGGVDNEALRIFDEL
ncbi:hypothetical protein F5Y16DRAFT_355764 [Xylariaceae sp. FL0255]|nr:hypothetical protein F5Y16DRAFT_355764 [Xylariaceae sp. FL0255]